MSKLTLSFDLPEEAEEANDAQKGLAWKCVVWNMDNYLRNMIKHREMSDDCRGYLEGCRDKLNSLACDEEVLID